MAYVIEKNVPPPKSVRGSGLMSTLRSMRGGESFVIAPSARGSAYSCARALGVRIAVRAEGENFRVWRIDSTKEAA